MAARNMLTARWKVEAWWGLPAGASSAKEGGAGESAIFSASAGKAEGARGGRGGAGGVGAGEGEGGTRRGQSLSNILGGRMPVAPRGCADPMGKAEPAGITGLAGNGGNTDLEGTPDWSGD